MLIMSLELVELALVVCSVAKGGFILCYQCFFYSTKTLLFHINYVNSFSRCKHVIAVDIDPQKIDCAHNNASIYGVNDRIDFIVGDFVHIAPHLKVMLFLGIISFKFVNMSACRFHQLHVFVAVCESEFIVDLGCICPPILG